MAEPTENEKQNPPSPDTSKEERLAWDRFFGTILAAVIPDSRLADQEGVMPAAIRYAGLVADYAMTERRRRFGECR
jgi:hypothetical protein